jgi:thioredoxin reductase (NADPH)
VDDDAKRVRPAIVAVDDDARALRRIEDELTRRYGADYHVACCCSALEALTTLHEIRARGEPVAIVLADQWMPEMSGTEFLERVMGQHPLAKRALLIDRGAWGDRATADAMLVAMARGRIWRPPRAFARPRSG